MRATLKNILAKRKLLISASIVVIGVTLAVLLVARRSNKPAQAAQRPLEVYFNLSEQEYLNFTRRNLIEAQRGGSVAQIELELADDTTYPHKGSFYYADRQVDQKTGAIRLAGIFLNPGNVLRPGQYGRVRAVTSNKIDALLVPQRAVTELQGSESAITPAHTGLSKMD